MGGLAWVVRMSIFYSCIHINAFPLNNKLNSKSSNIITINIFQSTTVV